MKKVIILGGGFAGVQTAIELQKTKNFEVILISDRDYLYLYPISIWVPVQMIEFYKAKVPLVDIQKKYPFKLIIDSCTTDCFRYSPRQEKYNRIEN